MATKIAEKVAREVVAALDAEDMAARIYSYKWNALVGLKRLFPGKSIRGLHPRFEWRSIGHVAVGGRGLISIEVDRASEERVRAAMKAAKLI